MTTDLADELTDRLRAALHDEATRAPLAAPEWAGAAYLGAPRRDPPRWLLPAAAVVAAAVAAAGATALTRRSEGRPAFRHAPPPFVHGSEETLEPSDVPPDFRPVGIVKPGSLRAVRRAEAPYVDVMYRSAMISPISGEVTCVDTNGGTGCAGLESLSYSVGGDMAEPPNPGWYPLTWSGLPDGTAYVQLVDADGAPRWQVPVASVAVFTNTGAREPRSLTAFDRDGTVLALAGPGRTTQREVAPLVDMTEFAGDATTELVQTPLRVFGPCLEAAGAADVHAPIGPTFPSGTDADATWSRCVAEASAAIVAKADELRRG